MLNIFLGLLMFAAGFALTYVAKLLNTKAARLAATIGVKLRGNRTSKAATRTCKAISYLLAVAAFLAIFIGPISLMMNGLTLTGYADWKAIADVFMANLLGVLCLPAILAAIKTESISATIDSVFNNKAE